MIQIHKRLKRTLFIITKQTRLILIYKKKKKSLITPICRISGSGSTLTQRTNDSLSSIPNCTTVGKRTVYVSQWRRRILGDPFSAPNQLAMLVQPVLLASVRFAAWHGELSPLSFRWCKNRGLI